MNRSETIISENNFRFYHCFKPGKPFVSKQMPYYVAQCKKNMIIDVLMFLNGNLT